MGLSIHSNCGKPKFHTTNFKEGLLIHEHGDFFLPLYLQFKEFVVSTTIKVQKELAPHHKKLKNG